MDFEFWFLLLFLYLAIGSCWAWQVNATYTERTKKTLSLLEVFVLNLLFMTLWPIVAILLAITQRR